MAEVWDDARWARSSRRWGIAVLAVGTVVAGGFALGMYARTQGVGPKVPAEVYRSVAGPDVRILRSTSGQDAIGEDQPEYLLVEVAGAGDPVEVLSATLRDHGWRVRPDGAALGGSPSPGDGGYTLSWQRSSALGASRLPLADKADRTDPRQLLLTIDNPPGLPA